MIQVGVSAAILVDHKVLLVKRVKTANFLPNFYELPGGRLEFGESPEEAVIREVREETGLEVEIFEIFHIFSSVNTLDNELVHHIDIGFKVKLKADSDMHSIRLSDEHDDYMLTDLKMLVGLTHVSTEMRGMIRTLLRGL